MLFSIVITRRRITKENFKLKVECLINPALGKLHTPVNTSCRTLRFFSIKITRKTNKSSPPTITIVRFFFRPGDVARLRLDREIPRCIQYTLYNDNIRQSDLPVNTMDRGALEVKVPMDFDGSRKIRKDTVECSVIHQLVANYAPPEVSVSFIENITFVRLQPRYFFCGFYCRSLLIINIPTPIITLNYRFHGHHLPALILD